MNSKVLLLSPLRKACGNYTTIHRIRSYLENEFVCMEWDPEDISDDKEFLSKLQESAVNVIIALHAYKAGRYLSENVSVPCILIFGGTDINVFYKNDDKLTTMTKAVELAKYVISFSLQMQDRALEIWPGLDQSKAVIINQGIQTKASSRRLQSILVDEGHMSLSEAENALIFLFVGGIRQVKDPIYLVKTMAELHEENKNIFYVIIGPELEKEYFKKFKNLIEGKAGIIYLGEMDVGDVHACIRDSHALVNTSESEATATVILEAMDLETPVIARKIGGNEALIQHGVTGFLFSSEKDFKEIAGSLIQNEKMQRKITLAAKEQIRKEHSPETEKNAYLKVIKKLLT